MQVIKYHSKLDVLLVNQTAETFQNVLVELSTLGDLKLVEKPAQFTLGPQSFHSMKATVKVCNRLLVKKARKALIGFVV